MILSSLSTDTIFSLALLALIFGGTAGLFGFLLFRQSRALVRALKALRDKNDGAERW